MTLPTPGLVALTKAIASETNQCVIWPFAEASTGYGNVSLHGKLMGAHRAVLVLVTGRDDPAEVARHGPCHNRMCVNPRHLRWGSYSENAQDRWRDGTHNAGERHYRARLTQEQVVEIRRRHAEGEGQTALGREYGVSASCINCIVKRYTWQHVA